ncbi:nucleotidyltransferase [Novosphingobium sp. AAP1]|uniref:HI0074 family nucleotidyltransferase substrate-binding subunit n=1 Tax=Novosphingobium sp. AAP1 TaxID=1523413 RepID=UPI0006B92A33|nr:HI0074 family nucleotidyltransferase substrate-binding subunit [Novosphingobium sp. AAP1]KPF53341.1 nucleotidyltransferase [Novosphingobium sp. AAP1]
MRRACLQIFSALDFTPLAHAVTGLREGLVRFATDEGDTQIRDGLIQRFEFTYDLSHKMLRRVIEAGAANPEEVDRMTFPTLIRTAAEQGLTGADWTDWRTWREMRNITSRTYDEGKARQLAQAIPAFLAQAQDLLARPEAARAA